MAQISGPKRRIRLRRSTALSWPLPAASGTMLAQGHRGSPCSAYGTECARSRTAPRRRTIRTARGGSTGASPRMREPTRLRRGRATHALRSRNDRAGTPIIRRGKGASSLRRPPANQRDRSGVPSDPPAQDSKVGVFGILSWATEQQDCLTRGARQPDYCRAASYSALARD